MLRKKKVSMPGLLSCLCMIASTLPSSLHAAQSSAIKIIEPTKKASPAKAAKIDTEKFQLGLYAGVMQVEDFGSSVLKGLSASYQVAEDYLILIHMASTRPGLNAVEQTSNNDQLPGDLRDLSYFTVSGAYRLYKARSFIGPKLKYDSDIYLSAGLGRTEFADFTGNGLSLGLSYRLVLTDWMVVTLDMKDHIYEQLDVFDPFSAVEPDEHTKTTQNLELSIGVNALF